MVMDFWAAVAVVLRDAWDSPRRYLITKGVGVYALMSIAGDLYLEAMGQLPDKRYFVTKLSEFVDRIDWSSQGTMSGLGGEGGVKAAVIAIRNERSKRQLRVV